MFVISTENSRNANHEGKLYGYHIRTAIGSSDTIHIIMKTSATKTQHFLSPIIISNRSILTDYSINPTWSGGSDVLSDVWSNNHESTNQSTIQVLQLGATVTDIGNIFYPDYYPATNQSAGSANPEFIGWMLKRNTFYAGRLTNLDAQSGIVKFTLFWTEM